MTGEADRPGPFGRRGCGTETAHLMLDYAITALGLHSVHLECRRVQPRRAPRLPPEPASARSAAFARQLGWTAAGEI